MADQEMPSVYHMVALQLVGRDRAGEVLDIIKKSGRAADVKVVAWATVDVNDKGKTRVRQMGRGGVGAGVGTGAGVVLGLLGGPAGLLAWALGGALVGGIAGKYLGHQFDATALKALGAGMAPNTSALVAVVEDRGAEKLAAEMGEYGTNVFTVTLGDQLSGELATYAAIELGEAAEEVAPEEGEAEETKEEA